MHLEISNWNSLVFLKGWIHFFYFYKALAPGTWWPQYLIRFLTLLELSKQRKWMGWCLSTIWWNLSFCILESDASVSCSVSRLEEEIKCVQYSHPQRVLICSSGLSCPSFYWVSVSSPLVASCWPLLLSKTAIVRWQWVRYAQMSKGLLREKYMLVGCFICTGGWVPLEWFAKTSNHSKKFVVLFWDRKKSELIRQSSVVLYGLSSSAIFQPSSF